ncbi:MAG: class I SAM-dependent methyltransferase [Chloroflexota bacterium]
MANTYIKTNRATWDEWAAVHIQQTSDYRIDDFRAGKIGWKRNIPDDIGSVKGKSLLHLQCHFGMDSLMWAREGAKVTGVDFSPTAIQTARTLNDELGLDAEFVQSDICSLAGALSGEFDIVLTYYGTIVWLPDLEQWADTIAWFLKPDGFFYMADSHPSHKLVKGALRRSQTPLHQPYFNDGEPIRHDTDGSTYADSNACTENRTLYQWPHSMSEIINALLGAGLTLDFLHEFPYTFHNMFYYDHHRQEPIMEQDEDNWWWLRDERISAPLMFSLMARKGRVMV